MSHSQRGLMNRTIQQRPLHGGSLVAEVGLPGRVGRWQLMRCVHRGPLTDVFQADVRGRTSSGVPGYAIKVLQPRWHDEPRALRMMQREAVLGERLSHPRLVSVLEAHVLSPPYYLVMPWLPGVTAAQRLRQHGPRPLAEALWTARQVAQALGVLAEIGWMHADVKPDNVLLSPEGHATLLDLGFARPLGEAEPIHQRCVAGTPSYLAPETLLPHPQCDIRSDLYSLGAMLYELLTGRVPFDGPDLPSLVQQHRQHRPAALRRLRPDVPNDVAQLVESMLAKEPLRRPQTPEEVMRRCVALEIRYFAERGFAPA